MTKKTVCVVCFLSFASNGVAQTPDSLKFFPAHAGDVRQYRSQFTGEITMTEYFDKDSTDQYGNVFVWRRGGGVYMIDTSNDVYYGGLLYKLNADTGVVWTVQKRSQDSILAKVVAIFPGFVFGKPVTVKKIDYSLYQSTGLFWIGNRYLATGFGFAQWDIEPSDVYVLSAAIINGVKYGTVVSVEREFSTPQIFEVLTNHPNPFNGSTIISYSISTDTHVNITIYDVLGRTVKTVVDERKQKGQFEFHLEASGMRSGLYFAVLRTNTNTLIHKFLYLK